MLSLLFSRKAASRDVLPGFLEGKYTAVVLSHACRCAMRNQNVNLNPLLLPLYSGLLKRLYGISEWTAANSLLMNFAKQSARNTFPVDIWLNHRVLKITLWTNIPYLWPGSENVTGSQSSVQFSQQLPEWFLILQYFVLGFYCSIILENNNHLTKALKTCEIFV